MKNLITKKALTLSLIALCSATALSADIIKQWPQPGSAGYLEANTFSGYSGRPLISQAAWNQNFEKVNEYAQLGANPFLVDRDANTALQNAGTPEIRAFLEQYVQEYRQKAEEDPIDGSRVYRWIEPGSDEYQKVNKQDPSSNNETELFKWVRRNQLDMVKYYIALGANPLIPDKMGRTPLERAKEGPVKTLLEHYEEAYKEAQKIFEQK